MLLDAFMQPADRSHVLLRNRGALRIGEIRREWTPAFAHAAVDEVLRDRFRGAYVRYAAVDRGLLPGIGAAAQRRRDRAVVDMRRNVESTLDDAHRLVRFVCRWVIATHRTEGDVDRIGVAALVELFAVTGCVVPVVGVLDAVDPAAL